VGAGFGLIGGPLGALGGAALGVVVQRAARAIGAQFSSREEQRIGTTITFILAEDQQRSERGDKVRDDGFFDDRGPLRSESEEVLEALFRQAAATYEERKLPYLAHLYARVAYDETISGQTAIYLLRIADQLTFRQLTILALAAARDQARRTGDDRYFEPQMDALLNGGERGSRVDPTIPAERHSLLDVRLLEEQVEASRDALTALGRLVVDAMQLGTIPEPEIEVFIRQAGGRI
jgi:hypothetical protein